MFTEPMRPSARNITRIVISRDTDLAQEQPFDWSLSFRGESTSGRRTPKSGWYARPRGRYAGISGSRTQVGGT